jgi:hypothetical protein
MEGVSGRQKTLRSIFSEKRRRKKKKRWVRRVRRDLVKGGSERLKEDWAVQIPTHKSLRMTLLMECSAGDKQSLRHSENWQRCAAQKR